MKTERKYLVEKVGKVTIVQLYADGFEELSLDDKILAFYLYRAALAGRDITYDQIHRHGLTIRNILEETVTHPQGIDEAILEKITHYLKLFWVFNGNYGTNSRKFVPRFSSEDLLYASKTAFSSGAQFGIKDESEFEKMLNELKRTIFDPDFEPILANKSPGEGEDVITASGNNYYEGVSLKDLEDFEEQYPLNSKVVKKNGQIIELVYRAGTDQVPPGLYADNLNRVIGYLKKAIPFAKQGQRRALEHLIRYFETGEPTDFEKYNIDWVKDNPTVETINGFIEVYDDARGAKGEFEGMVCFVDQKINQVMKNIANLAQYFEEKAPWDDRYKKRNITAPVANAVTLLLGVGGEGPISALGINLPNAQNIRETYGSKNFILTNVSGVRYKLDAERITREFALTEEEFKLDKTVGEKADLLETTMHEILGHGSGKVSQRLKKDPAFYLQEYYSSMEEARSDLVALWHIFDEKLMNLADIDARCGEALYRSYARADLIRLRTVKEGDRLEKDHARARHMIISYIKDKTKAIDVVEKNGKVYLSVNDIGKMRQGVGELLSMIMKIKAEGDYQEAKRLVEKYGIKINPQWRDQILKRAEAINLPDHYAFVMPELELVTDKSGKIADVSISYPQDFTKQQLKYSGKI
ncbi:MAG: peptidase M49 [candidate division Zixibacteria bacterium]|nr:peptidase M49 [candidate division Zixibacteria bacterium]